MQTAAEQASGSASLAEPTATAVEAIPDIDPRTLPFAFGELPPEVRQAVQSTRNLDLGERIGAISACFLGRPYVEGCTGEGSGPDADPPVRFDVFDCMTFVEEVLALALAPDPAEAGTYLRILRYGDADPVYQARHHFFEAEWIPANLRNGLLRDITAEVGHASMMEKTVPLSVWQHWRRRPRFAFDDARLPTGTLRMPYLGLAEAVRAVPRIPPGAIVVTMRSNVAHLPIVVTHLGLTVPGDVPILRHATHMSSRRVRDDRLAWYVEHLESYDHWPVAGIRVLLPVEQGPRDIPTSPEGQVGRTP
jgi:hypothetical protein